MGDYVIEMDERYYAEHPEEMVRKQFEYECACAECKDWSECHLCPDSQTL